MAKVQKRSTEAPKPVMGRPISEIKWDSIKPKKPKDMKIPELVDHLGRLRSKIAPLNDQYGEACGVLIKYCRKRPKTIDGELYRAAVSFIAAGTTLDAEKVKKLLTKAQIKRCSKPTKPKAVVRVSARLRDQP